MQQLSRAVSAFILSGKAARPCRVLDALEQVCGDNGWGGDRSLFKREWLARTAGKPEVFEKDLTDRELSFMLQNFKPTLKQPKDDLLSYEDANDEEKWLWYKPWQAATPETFLDTQDFYRRAGLFAESFFTTKERRAYNIFRRYADGESNAHIAEALGHSHQTVDETLAFYTRIMLSYDFDLLDAYDGDITGDACAVLDKLQGISRLKRLKAAERVVYAEEPIDD